MTELMKCSRCHSEILPKYFGENRKGKPYKTCIKCRTCRAKYRAKEEKEKIDPDDIQDADTLEIL